MFRWVDVVMYRCIDVSMFRWAAPIASVVRPCRAFFVGSPLRWASPIAIIGHPFGAFVEINVIICGFWLYLRNLMSYSVLEI